ncbi:T9SS type B sorting domain-containing protein [Niastella caeni]|uniref:T9SS type B sorting domain-containing protein n=1 Tax=Niastella caeni TaxID=2569763 RepID=A0A4S8HYM7_9BACT|nr:PKD domain-containing protein [Niastella caeni]THU39274.1 T9SS type B sorting domain-containing protein [Niastella caeni]
MVNKHTYEICLRVLHPGFSKAVATCVFLCMMMMGDAQTPGGVSGNLTSWFKANSQVGGNILPNTTHNTRINEWKSELGNLSVTQAITNNMPLFLANYTAAANFNFNPSLQFASSQIRGLTNTSATAPELLGNNGTYFLVLNTTRETGFTSSTCFSYNSNSTGARYQAKADFRIQTGIASFGYIADLDPASTGLNPAGIPAITYPRSSAVVLTSRSAGPTFRARRNADTTILGSGAVYYPAIGSGLGIGFNSPGGSEASSSAIAEVITYDTYLSDADVNKVESYLAVKYGITLSQSNTFTVPATPTNYSSAGGTIIWNGVANTGYGKCITGIGRDDVSALMQKQSKSVHDSSLVYLYNGNVAGSFPAMNANNISSFSTNNSFLLFGDNGLSRNLTACVYSGKISSMQRVWKVQKTGTIGAVSLAVDATAVNASVKNLLVSNDPLFPEGATTIYPLSAASGKLYTTVTLNSNQYFTFASDSLKVVMAVTQPTCTAGNGGGVTTAVTGGVMPYTYSWNTTPVQTTANATGLKGGNYQLTVKTGSGCSVVYPVTLVTPVFPVISATTAQPVICQGENVTLTASVISGTVTGYTWMPGNATGASINVTPTDTTTYRVIGNDGAGCTDTAFVTVHVIPEPVAAFTPNVTIGCPPLAVTFNNQSQNTDAWKWTFGDGGTATSANPVYTYNNAGDYTVTLMVSSQGKCFDTLVKTNLIQLKPSPVAAFTSTGAENVPVEMHLASFIFNNGSQHANSYTWDFGDGDSSSTTSPSHKYRDAGNYIVTLHAMNDIGCVDSAMRKYYMVIPDNVLVVPNAFSPNGDGINDRWEIAGLRNVTNCYVEIFNRWGQSIYRSTGYANPWDGTFKGKAAPVATYYYIIKTATRNYNGWVALIR